MKNIERFKSNYKKYIVVSFIVTLLITASGGYLKYKQDQHKDNTNVPNIVKKINV